MSPSFPAQHSACVTAPADRALVGVSLIVVVVVLVILGIEADRAVGLAASVGLVAAEIVVLLAHASVRPHRH